jgi:hypothetical protein
MQTSSSFALESFHAAIVFPAAMETLIAMIVPLSNTQQVIFLKLTNTNYLF